MNDMVAEVLGHARDRIEDGWCQLWSMRVSADGDTEYCALGALNQGLMDCKGLRRRDIYERMDVSNAAYKSLQDVLPAECSDDMVVVYNDAPGRTKEDILELYDRAIESVKEAA